MRAKMNENMYYFISTYFSTYISFSTFGTISSNKAKILLASSICHIHSHFQVFEYLQTPFISVLYPKKEVFPDSPQTCQVFLPVRLRTYCTLSAWRFCLVVFSRCLFPVSLDFQIQKGIDVCLFLSSQRKSIKISTLRINVC